MLRGVGTTRRRQPRPLRLPPLNSAVESSAAAINPWKTMPGRLGGPRLAAGRSSTLTSERDKAMAPGLGHAPPFRPGPSAGRVAVTDAPARTLPSAKPPRQVGRRAWLAHGGHRAGRVVLPDAVGSSRERALAGDFGGRAADSACRRRLAAVPGRQGQVPGSASWRGPGHCLVFVSAAVRLGLLHTGQSDRPESADGPSPGDPRPAGPGPGQPRVHRSRATRPAGASGAGRSGCLARTATAAIQREEQP